MAAGMLLLLAAIMLSTVGDYGITGDEAVRNRYGRKLLRWYTSLGSDRAAVANVDISRDGGVFEITTGLVQEVLVADANLAEVSPGETGELLMTGPQLTVGYLDDPERTARAFVVPPGRQAVYYRTGDLVRRPVGGAPLLYLGRADNQIKIQGYRVELGEVEQVLRDVSGAEVAVALGWPQGGVVADSVVAFIVAPSVPMERIRAEMVKRLPPYVQPSKILIAADWPLNSNGKIDRAALYRLVQQEQGAPGAQESTPRRGGDAG
jgi:acyl-coenzyme A synthetase/AMP-(fatty) acid ligase